MVHHNLFQDCWQTDRPTWASYRGAFAPKNQTISKNSIRSASKDKIWNNWNNCQNITKSDNINDYVTICDNIWQRGQYLKMTQYLPIYDNIW